LALGSRKKEENRRAKRVACTPVLIVFRRPCFGFLSDAMPGFETGKAAPHRPADPFFGRRDAKSAPKKSFLARFFNIQP